MGRSSSAGVVRMPSMDLKEAVVLWTEMLMVSR